MKQLGHFSEILWPVFFTCLLPLVVLARSPVPNPDDAQRDYLVFDGAATVAATALSADTLPGDLTVEAWVRVADWRAGRRQTILSAWGGDEDAYGWRIGLDWGQFAYWNHQGPVHTTGPHDGQWTHLAVAIEAGQAVKLYVDGVITREVSISAGGENNSSKISLGARKTDSGWGDHFRGEIANVRIWKGLRSPELIRQSMQAHDLTTASDLLANWPLLEGWGAEIKDHSVNEQHAVVQNGEWQHHQPAPALSTEQPLGLLLNWIDDPSTSMTIDWHTQPYHDAAPILAWALDGAHESHDGWQTAQAESIRYPFSHRKAYRVNLSGLEPDSLYHFRLKGFSRTYSFTTLPVSLEGRSLKIAIGGDLLHRAGARGTGGNNRRLWFSDMNRVVAEEDPAFAVVGGDLAYADGEADQTWRWYLLFTEALDTLITPEGRVIPMMMGIGNHEVRRGYYYHWQDYEQTDAKREALGPYFFNLLPWPGQPGYATFDAGDYLSILMLDTDHANPIEGAQTDWLAERLEERRTVKHVWPVYHVAGYTSARDFDGQTESAIRTHWMPLFEDFGRIRVAFENHDHTYKRTPPIRAGAVVPAGEGITFLGDGAWGVGLRSPRSAEDTWYLERSEQKHHVIIAEISEQEAAFRVIDSEGMTFDTYSYTVPE